MKGLFVAASAAAKEMLMGSINYCGDLVSYNDENVDYFTNQTNKDKNMMQFIEIEAAPCLNADQFQFKVLCAGKLFSFFPILLILICKDQKADD